MNLGKLNPIAKIREMGLGRFTQIWLGQLVSIIGSGMTAFAMQLWAWGDQQNATSLVLMSFCYALPMLILMPFAGSIVDRFSKKKVMIIGDSGAAVVTLFLFAMTSFSKLEIWMAYLAVFVQAIFNTFHMLAYGSMIATIVPEEQLGRVSGMRSFSSSLGSIIAPILAGGLVAIIGYKGVFIIDLLTFCAAVLTLSFTKIPYVKPEPHELKTNIFKDAFQGFAYVAKIPTLLGLTIITILSGFFFQFGALVVNPMILARTGGDAISIGLVDSICGVAGLLGSLLLIVWGGPKRRMLAGIFFTLGMSFGLVMIGIGRNLAFWIAGAFVWIFFGSLMSVEDAFFQSKIPAKMQGRVFGAMGTFSNMLAPLSFGFAGVLADKLFEPAMKQNGLLSGIFGWLVGNEKGSGMALMIVFAGLISILISAVAFLIKPIREADTIMPDINND